jgi:hypothetical protein
MYTPYLQARRASSRIPRRNLNVSLSSGLSVRRPQYFHGGPGVLTNLIGHTYSPDQRYLAVVGSTSGKEAIGIYDTAAGYKLVRVSSSVQSNHRKLIDQHFPLQANDVQCIRWSPCGRYIAATNSCLSVCQPSSDLTGGKLMVAVLAFHTFTGRYRPHSFLPPISHVLAFAFCPSRPQLS